MKRKEKLKKVIEGVRELKDKRNFSFSEITRGSGISRTTIRRIYHNDYFLGPTDDTLDILLEYIKSQNIDKEKKTKKSYLVINFCNETIDVFDKKETLLEALEGQAEDLDIEYDISNGVIRIYEIKDLRKINFKFKTKFLMVE